MYRYQENGKISTTDGKAFGIYKGHRGYKEVQEWLDQGNTIEPYVPPVPQISSLIDSEMDRGTEDIWLAIKELGGTVPTERQEELDRKAAWRTQLKEIQTC
jgi:hypothetical protein